MHNLILILFVLINVGCNSSSGVFEPGDSSDDTAVVVATEKLTGFSESNNLGAYLDANKTINDAFSLVEINTYISDVVINNSGVASGDTVPAAINKILTAIDNINPPPIEDNTLFVIQNNYDEDLKLQEELRKLLDRSNYEKKFKDETLALYSLIKEQQKEIQKLKYSLNELSNKKNNLY